MEQPKGMCGAGAGCCGGPCNATTSFFGSACRAMRSALRLTDLRCFIFPLRVKLFQVLRIAHGQLGVNLETRVGPSADPFAVVQIRMRGLAVARVGFVVAAAGAQGSRQALGAIRLGGDVMFFEEADLHQPVDAAAHGAQLVLIGTGEAVAQSHVAIGGDAHQSQARAARISFTDALVNLFQRVLHVRESVMPVFQCGFEELLGERLELAEHGVESGFRDRVLAVGRRGDGCEADFPESDLFGEMPEDFANVERLGSECDARADGTAAMPAQQLADFGRDYVVAAGSETLDIRKIFRHLTEEIGFWEVGFAPVTTSPNRKYAIAESGFDAMLAQFQALAQEFLEAALENRHPGFSNVNDTPEQLHNRFT